MSYRTVTKRKKPPHPVIFETRRDWGARLLVELKRIRKTPEWLGALVGYKVPSSMRQVINGHQGMSREVYERIIAAMPEMRDVAAPPMTRERKGLGAYGPHKPHDYPKLGPIASRRPRD